MDSKQLQFEALVKAYSNDLYRLAYWFCNNHSLADDLVQESFMRAWKSIDKLKDDKAAKAWLITILRREFARHCGNKHSKQLSLEDIELEQLAVMQHKENMAENELLHKVMANLPDDYRIPLVLQVLGGYTSDEIAAIMDIKPGAVMTRLFRARKQLKNSLQMNSNIINIIESNL